MSKFQENNENIKAILEIAEKSNKHELKLCFTQYILWKTKTSIKYKKDHRCVMLDWYINNEYFLKSEQHIEYILKHQRYRLWHARIPVLEIEREYCDLKKWFKVLKIFENQDRRKSWMGLGEIEIRLRLFRAILYDSTYWQNV